MSEKETSWFDVLTAIVKLIPLRWNYQIEKFTYQFERGGTFLPYEEWLAVRMSKENPPGNT